MKALLITCAVALFFVAGVTKADNLFFLDAGTAFPGDSTFKGYEKMIQVLSFNLGVKNTVTIGSHAGGGAGAGKPTFSPITIYKYADIASPLLFLACAKGTEIKNPVVLHALSSSGGDIPTYREYLTITLNNVVVSSINDSGPDQNNASEVAESLTLVCGSMKMSVKSFGPNGNVLKTVTEGWDLTNNKVLPGSTAPPSPP